MYNIGCLTRDSDSVACTLAPAGITDKADKDMIFAGTTEELPQEVINMMSPEDVEDFGFIDTDPSELPGGSVLPSGVDAVFDAMPIFLGIFAVVFVIAVIFIAFVWARNYKAAKNAGFDPFTLETELAVRAANSGLLAPAQQAPQTHKSLEQKLTNLDRLLAKGSITSEEHKAARLKLLSE